MNMLKPHGARVLIQRITAPRPSSDLLIIPETIQDKPSIFAMVLAIGKLQQGGIAPGDMVVIKDYTGAPCTIELDGETIEAAVVPEADVLMKVSE